MKKLITYFIALVMTFGLVEAQETFQGTLNYDFKMMGEGVEAYQAMLPTGMSMTVLKSDMIIEMQGGMAAMMMGKIIVKGKKGLSYMIKDSEETIYVMDPAKMKGDDDEAEKPEPTITKEDETLTIAGYECQKYKVEAESPQGTVTQYVWVTDKLKMPEMKSSGNMAGGMGGGLSMKGLPGIPLKTMNVQGPMTVIMTVKEVDLKLPSKKLFKLPKGYAKEDFDMEAMMKSMGG
ncbi:MAG TPA: DUF4412 domain-containing protein [Bacteroidetes bacterium]|nr:DUF4412 domain-containing protein [Bacteroidota bacterium]